MPLEKAITLWLISIHAPAQGATVAVIPLYVWHQNFNPRPRAGGDLEAGVSRRAVEISIHAPAQGATGFASLSLPLDA